MVFETTRLGISLKTFRRFKKASKSLRKKEQKVFANPNKRRTFAPD